MPEDVLELLRERAKAKGIGVGEYVRCAIALQFAYELGVERRPGEPPSGGQADG